MAMDTLEVGGNRLPTTGEQVPARSVDYCDHEDGGVLADFEGLEIHAKNRQSLRGAIEECLIKGMRQGNYQKKMARVHHYATTAARAAAERGEHGLDFELIIGRQPGILSVQKRNRE